MSKFLDEVCDQLNLRWAWEKARMLAAPGDNWFDEVEVAAFDLELERNLESIAVELNKGQYRLSKLRPLPFPKDRGKQKDMRVRQQFQITMRDQVAWIAVVNVVGPRVDSKMPAWSYGNRLYRSIWVDEDEDGHRERKIGQYRHTSGRLYLSFNQSWPVFRRHVYLATRAMTMDRDKIVEDLDQSTRDEFEFQKWLEEEHRCPFVSPEYWKDRKPQIHPQNLYWCSIDLQQFYPKLGLDVVRENIVEQLPDAWKEDANSLIASMLKFRLTTDGWEDSELKTLRLRAHQKQFKHIPTGLFVAGFLANSGLLKIDWHVNEQLKSKSNRVAHFRFVDDHILLAYSFGELVHWVREYKDLLLSGVKAQINPDKVEPPELARLITDKNWKPIGEQNTRVLPARLHDLI